MFKDATKIVFNFVKFGSFDWSWNFPELAEGMDIQILFREIR